MPLRKLRRQHWRNFRTLNLRLHAASRSRLQIGSTVIRYCWIAAILPSAVASNARLESFNFSAGGTPNNSVLVNGRRTVGSPSGPIPLFFGNVFGTKFFEPTTQVTATYIERDIVLVVDRSGSMRGQKFDDLVNAIETFTSTLNQTPVEEQVGLASYSEFSTEDVILTGKLTQINNAVAALPVGGFTSISRGMESGRDDHESQPRQEVRRANTDCDD